MLVQESVCGGGFLDALEIGFLREMVDEVLVYLVDVVVLAGAEEKEDFRFVVAVGRGHCGG